MSDWAYELAQRMSPFYQNQLNRLESAAKALEAAFAERERALRAEGQGKV